MNEDYVLLCMDIKEEGRRGVKKNQRKKAVTQNVRPKPKGTTIHILRIEGEMETKQLK